MIEDNSEEVDGMAPASLLEVGRAEVARYGVTLIEGQVERIDASFDAHLRNGWWSKPAEWSTIGLSSVASDRRHAAGRETPTRRVYLSGTSTLCE